MMAATAYHLLMLILPEALRIQTIVEIPLLVIRILRIPRPAQQIFSQFHHVVNNTMLLVFITKAGPELSHRAPDFAGCLAAVGIHAALLNCLILVSLHDLAIILLAGHFVSTGIAMHLGDGRIGMHIAEHINTLKQRLG